MRVVDVRPDPGTQLIRPTIPSVAGDTLPSCRLSQLDVRRRSHWLAPAGHRGSPTHEPPES
jgi:hypothetical protein